MAYPSDLDSFTPVVDNIDDIMAVDVNELQTALASLEVKLGVDGSAVITSIDYLLKNSASIDPGHRHSKLYQSDNGDVAVTVDANGNVGIGTTAPGEILEIETATPVLRIDGTSTSYPTGSTIEFGAPYAAKAGAIDFVGGIAGGRYLDFRLSASGTNNTATSMMRVLDTGNVGIGTTNPERKLTVNGGASNPLIQVVSDATGTGISDGGYFGLNGADIVLGNQETTGGNVKIFVDNDFSKGMIIEENTGNVGIGTTTPATKLEINGALTLTELSADPTDPAEGKSVLWQSNGTGSGDDGDILMKITAGGTTKTVTIVDFSAL